jgi:apolipoprotein N-acyltransferase
LLTGCSQTGEQEAGETRTNREDRGPIQARNGRFQEGSGGAGTAAGSFDNCYTDVTRRLVRDGARLIAVPNYDPPTPRGILHYLHAAMLPFRAVENRVPIVRADANGCSQIVDATGRVVGQSPLYAPDALVGDVALGDGAETLYTRVGDAFAYLCLLVVVLGALTAADVKRRTPGVTRKSDQGAG